MRSLACGVPIIVTPHARERAKSRFPGFKGARIVDEVRAAVKEGRFSALKPDSVSGQAGPSDLYAWTPDSRRIYAVRSSDDALVVTTTLRADR